MIKINPFVNQGASVAERFSSRASLEKANKPGPEKADVVSISSEAKRKHIMGQLIARITADAASKKL